MVSTMSEIIVGYKYRTRELSIDDYIEKNEVCGLEYRYNIIVTVVSKSGRYIIVKENGYPYIEDELMPILSTIKIEGQEYI